MQTVEIHEPLRILFVVETTPQRLMSVKQGRLTTLAALQYPERKMQRMPTPVWIRLEEDGFFFVRGPKRTSPGRLWEFQQMNDDRLVCLHVPNTPYRLVLRRAERTEPSEWLAKLFAHSCNWMDRHEKSA